MQWYVIAVTIRTKMGVGGRGVVSSIWRSKKCKRTPFWDRVLDRSRPSSHCLDRDS